MIKSGSLRSQVGETLRIVESCHDRSAGMPSAPRIRLDADGSCHFIIKDVIYFVESKKNQHKLLVHLRSEMFTLSMSLRDMPERLRDRFIVCRRGCLINPRHIKAIDRDAREVIFDNKERYRCSHRAWRLVAERTGFCRPKLILILIFQRSEQTQPTWK